MKIATKLTKRVAEFVNENRIGRSDFHYVKNLNAYYHHEPYLQNNHQSGIVHQDYTSVSEQEFIDMVTADLARDPEKPKEMKTKCIVLGQENEPVKELKKIEFVKNLNSDGEFISSIYMEPIRFENIELISKNYCNNLDLMFAYNKDRNHDHEAILILGHWNDGVV